MRALHLLIPLSLTVLVAACGDDGASGTDSTNESASAATDQVASNDPAPANPGNNGTSVDGQITAMLDGEERTWYVTSKMMGGERQSQSDYSDMGIATSVSIFGHATSNSVFGSKQALLIGFSLYWKGETPNIDSPEIEYLKGGMTQMYSSSQDGNAEITLTSAQMDGEALKISGTFSGTLKFFALGGKEPEDGQTEVTVTDGSFDVTIGGLVR